MLALAVSLADYPLGRAFDCTGDARSRTCGSEIVLGCDLDADKRITNIGMQVKACAIGQASAAIFAASARGADMEVLTGTLEALGRWLKGEEAMPVWTRLDMLETALAHPGRHEAILLPWRAALAALSNAGLPR